VRRSSATSGRPTDDDDAVVAPAVATAPRGRDRPGPPPAARSRTFRRRGHTRPRAPKICRRTRTPRQEGRPTRTASTRTTRARGPASLTPAKGSRLGKCPGELAAPASRQRPAGRRVREVRRPGPRTLSRPPDGQSGRQNDTYERPATPRGQRAADRREEGSGTAPILRIWCTDRERFWRSTRRIAAVFCGSKVYARPSDTLNAARAATGQPTTVNINRPHRREVCTGKDMVRIDHLQLAF